MVISSTPVQCDGMAGLIKTLGFKSVTCSSKADGGCSCSALIEQKGGLALVLNEPPTNATYVAQGSTLTVTGDSNDANYSYCAKADTLTVSPHSTSPQLAGTVAFSAVKSSGGTSAQGGATASGGTMSTGGAAGSGGVTNSGGVTAAGGTTSTGGLSGSGGATNSGGVTAAGGAKSTGGAPGSGGAGMAGATGTGGSVGGAGDTAPCDLFKGGGTPCVVAHSSVRALFSGYSGRLYQVRNAAGATKDISATGPGGVADAAAQDAFCTGTTCVYTVIYDQAGKGVDLWYEAPDSKVGGGSQMTPASATKESIKVKGSKVYSVYIQQGNAFWADGSKLGLPLGAEPEGIYMVTSGTHTGGVCCFDYGNTELGRKVGEGGSMDAINFSKITAWQTGAGSGPWILADLEFGLFSSGDKSVKVNPSLPSMTMPFVTAVLKNNGKEYALRGADATSGALTTFYKGKLPGSYMMKKEGAVALGSGGDCCLTNKNLGEGTFYEGAIVAGYPSDAVEDAVQENIVAARYSK
jgi:hypothetical protein